MEKLDKALLTFTKSFLPKDVLKMSEEKQLKYVKKWSNTKLPDIKITKLGNVREKRNNGKWETIQSPKLRHNNKHNNNNN